MRPGELSYALAGSFHRLAWVEFGDPAAPPLICVHGLTRNGRDFDPLAAALSKTFRVICPDMPGRGASAWLPDPALYQTASYVTALSHLLASLGRQVMWVGTSMGGIIGMAIAAMPGQPIARMVLNDVGPFIPAAALARIGRYLGHTAEFDDLAGLERHLREVHAPFGPLTDAQWAHLAAHSARTLPSGRIGMHYDPAIARPFLDGDPADIDLWPVWDAITIPVLAIRGANSDLLLPQTLDRMTASGAQSHVVTDAGHAPALMDAPTIGVIRRFLTGALPD